MCTSSNIPWKRIAQQHLFSFSSQHHLPHPSWLSFSSQSFSEPHISSYQLHGISHRAKNNLVASIIVIAALPPALVYILDANMVAAVLLSFNENVNAPDY
jgi:hypothetical protein